jgi:hypothetical protein
MAALSGNLAINHVAVLEVRHVDNMQHSGGGFRQHNGSGPVQITKIGEGFEA